ncbi:MAG: SRPBCC domain-containing protein [Myxococcales bacterium]|nr:SRPBCC domain-containing protein [Myxococcales bacterium]
MSGRAETQTISLSWDLPHPPAKVWRALTEPELLAKWLMANDLRLAVGHRFTLKQEPTPWWDGMVHCEVLEIEPPKRIRTSWRRGLAALLAHLG